MSRLLRVFIVAMLAFSSVASFGVVTAQEGDDLRFVIVSHGQAADPGATGSGASIRAFNARVLADQRVEAVQLNVADGLTVARRLG